MTSTLSYTVAGMSCEHCVEAVTEELSTVAGIANVTVDLAAKHVEVTGDHLDDAAIRAAIEEAGYEAS